MNEEEYKKLFSICDQILLADNCKLARIAIPWLHILREHPVLIKKYTPLFSDKDFLKSFLNNVSIIVKGLIHIASSVLSTNYLSSHSKEDRKIDYLFVSHILNEKQAGLNDDFYFGSVPSLLSKRGKSVVIILLNHSRVSASKLSRKWSGAVVPRVILTKKISLRKSILIYWQMLNTFFEIHSFSRRASDSFTRRVALNAAVEALSAGSFANMRLERQIGSFVKDYKPFSLIVTYEGHAYERMVFHGTQRINSDILRVGYQHSALFRLQHSFSRMLNTQFNCDLLFTSSLLVKQKLLDENKMDGVLLEVLGSNRGIDLNKENVIAKSNSCLVLPEGFVEECNILFSCSLEIARKMPEMQFVWRLHPAISFEYLKTTNKLFNKIPPNIILSDMSLDDDIQRCSIALYRGTTAIVKAVAEGLVPVYLKVTEDEMTIDPLYDINKGKLMVGGALDFFTLFEPLNAIKNYQQKTEEIRKFCRNFFNPIDINVFEKIQRKSNLN